MTSKVKNATAVPVRLATEEHASAGQALRERLKEITCLYDIRQGMGLELSLDKG